MKTDTFTPMRTHAFLGVGLLLLMTLSGCSNSQAQQKALAVVPPVAVAGQSVWHPGSTTPRPDVAGNPAVLDNSNANVPTSARSAASRFYQGGG